MDEKFLKIFRDDDMMHDIPEYQANVEKADYLSRKPLMDTSKISPENRELFQRVKYNYAKAWSLQSVITLKRKSLKNFSPLSPVRMIATRRNIRKFIRSIITDAVSVTKSIGQYFYLISVTKTLYYNYYIERYQLNA